MEDNEKKLDLNFEEETPSKEEVKQEPVKDLSTPDPQKILLTEEEFAKKERLKARERINRVTRVAGLFAILLLIYAGVLDVLFELSFFGWIWDKIKGTEVFSNAWQYLRTVKVFDDVFMFGPWIGQLGITILLIAVIVLLVYFITYCVVDIIEFFRNLIATGKDITADLKGNLQDSADDFRKGSKPKTEIFKKQSTQKRTTEKKEPIKKENIARRTNHDDNVLNDMSAAQLDALLSGASMEEVTKKSNKDERDRDNPASFLK